MFHMKQISDQALEYSLEYLKNTESLEIMRDALTSMGAIWSMLLLFKFTNWLRVWALPKGQGGQL